MRSLTPVQAQTRDRPAAWTGTNTLPDGALPPLSRAPFARGRLSSDGPVGGLVSRGLLSRGPISRGLASRGPFVLARVAAVAALAALLLHLLVAAGHAHQPLFAIVVGLMGLMCAVCAIRCLRSPCLQELTALLIMTAAMVSVHAAWLLFAGGAAGGDAHGSAHGSAHEHGSAMSLNLEATTAGAGNGATTGAMSAAGEHAASAITQPMLGLAVAELVVAALCAVAIRRHSFPPAPTA